MMTDVPVTSSWPTRKISLNGPCAHEEGEQLSHEQLQAWLQCLACGDDGHLVIAADSLLLLPAQLPYELLGPCILAAADSLAAIAWAQCSTGPAQGKAASTIAPQQQQQQQALGLQLYGIDLQEPIAAPLLTCFTAYPFLQQLVLCELNVDAHVACVLGSLVQHNSCSSSGSALVSLDMTSVFMCGLAWEALTKRIAAGCQLHALRLHDCLNTSTLGLLAAAIPAGCSSLQQLDLSCNALEASSDANSSTDHAWAGFIDALVQPCCTDLQGLDLSSCPLGPAAAAALERLLHAKARSGLQRLSVARCAGMGEGPTRQLAVAAASHPSLRMLDMSCTNLADIHLRSLAGQGSSRWPWQQQACPHLQELHLGSNILLTGAGVAQLATALTAGSLSRLQVLDLANCPGIGDAGALSLASCLASCHCQLTVLDLSGCEVTDEGVAALAAAVSGDSIAAAPALATSAGPGAARGAVCRNKQQAVVSLRELRLADNQITAAGMQHLAAAIQKPSCMLRLLDVSYNWAGPDALRPLVEAATLLAATSAGCAAVHCSSSQDQQAEHCVQDCSSCDSSCQHAQRPRFTLLRECSHDMWRVEAAKAAAKAAAAADVAAAATAEAAAAAAAAGSSWDPHGSDQLSVQQHPAAATALGFTNSSYEGCSGSSMRTHAGSPVGLSPLQPAAAAARRWPSGVWHYNGLFCQPGEASGGSPDSTGEAEAVAGIVPEGRAAGDSRQHLGQSSAACRLFPPVDTAGHSPAADTSSRSQACREGTTSQGICMGRSSRAGSLVTNGSLDRVESGQLAGNGSNSNIDLAEETCSEISSRVGSPTERADSLGGEAAAAADVADPWGSAALAAALEAVAPGTAAGSAGAAGASGHAADTDSCDADGASCDGLTVSVSGSGSSQAGSCIQQEVSFRYQFNDDVVHSPTRYDQQQQQQQQLEQLRQHPDDNPHQQQRQHGQQQRQQQLKGLLGSHEFTLSPPNPLYFSSSPLTSPLPPCKLLGRTAAAAEPVLQPGPFSGAGCGRNSSSGSTLLGETNKAGPAAPSIQPPEGCFDISVPHQPPFRCMDFEIAHPEANPLDQAMPSQHMPCHDDSATDTTAAAVAAATNQAQVQQPERVSLAVGAGRHAIMQLRQPYSPDRQVAAPTIRALPPGSPRRRCGLFATPSPPAASIAALATAAAAAGGSCLRPVDVHVPVPAAVLQSVRDAAAAGQQPGMAGPCCSSGSGSSIGSSKSPMCSTGRSVRRHRVGASPQVQPPSAAAAVSDVNNCACAVALPTDFNQPQVQHMAMQIIADDNRGSPSWPCHQQQLQPLSSESQAAALKQAAAARQLFPELHCLQHCEVKVAASSGSFWCNLWLMNGGVAGDVSSGVDLGVSCMHDQHAHALPLVSG